MAFRRTYLSHRRRHEELAENNMQYDYSCCGGVCQGDRTASVMEGARTGVSSSNSSVHSDDLAKDGRNATRDARCTKPIDTIFVWKKL